MSVARAASWIGRANPQSVISLIKVVHAHRGSALSRKKTPFAYGEPDGPRIVETHSYKLSPFGPAEQLHGGSRLISASSFWILHITKRIWCASTEAESINGCRVGMRVINAAPTASRTQSVLAL